MKKNILFGLILAAVTAPVLASGADYPEIDNPTKKVNSYTLEVKEESGIVTTSNFSATYGQESQVQNWINQSVALDNWDSTQLVVKEAKYGFGMKLRPMLENKDLVTLSFEYRDHRDLEIKNTGVEQTIYTFDTSITLPTGNSFCRNISNQVEMCLSRR